MSTFSKKYYSPKDPKKFLSVTWETGYKNIQVFDEDRLVHTIPQPAVLMEGVKIKDEQLGTLKFSFSLERPRKLEIKVNNKKYKPLNKLDLHYDYTGLITVFSALAVFAGIEGVIIGGVYGFDFSITGVTIFFVIEFIFVISYGLTSYFLSKKKPWIYFLGTFLFSLTTLTSTIGLFSPFTSIWNWGILIFRYVLLAYILLQVKYILKEMKRNNSRQNTEVIDNL